MGPQCVHSATVFGSGPKFRMIVLFGGMRAFFGCPIAATTLLHLGECMSWPKPEQSLGKVPGLLRSYLEVAEVHGFVSACSCQNLYLVMTLQMKLAHIYMYICKLLLRFWGVQNAMFCWAPPVISHWCVYHNQHNFPSICLRAAGGQLEGDKGEKTKARKISWEAKGADGEATTGFIRHDPHKVWGDCRETMSDIIGQLK